MRKNILAFSIFFSLSLVFALPREVSSLHTRRRQPNIDLSQLTLKERIEVWAKSSIGFVSQSRAVAGFKCADQVSQVLSHAKAGALYSFGVEQLVRNLQQAGWSQQRFPQAGCILYSFYNMPARRSHVGIVVGGSRKLKDQVLKIFEDNNVQGQEDINEFLEIQRQLPYVNRNDANLLIEKLNHLSSKKKRSPQAISQSEQHRQKLLQLKILDELLYRFQYAGGESLTVVHNQIAALREGPFNMEDALWMLKARILCP